MTLVKLIPRIQQGVTIEKGSSVVLIPNLDPEESMNEYIHTAIREDSIKKLNQLLPLLNSTGLKNVPNNIDYFQLGG